jgi:DNA repair exonuclease SbcCD ATPase subunit
MKTHSSEIIVGLMLTILLFIQPGLAQTSEELKSLRKELEELKQSQKAIQKDLQEIKNRLQSMGVLPEEPKNLFLNIASKPFTGDRNAKLFLIEFSEYQ